MTGLAEQHPQHQPVLSHRLRRCGGAGRIDRPREISRASAREQEESVGRCHVRRFLVGCLDLRCSVSRAALAESEDRAALRADGRLDARHRRDEHHCQGQRTQCGGSRRGGRSRPGSGIHLFRDHSRVRRPFAFQGDRRPDRNARHDEGGNGDARQIDHDVDESVQEKHHQAGDACDEQRPFCRRGAPRPAYRVGHEESCRDERREPKEAGFGGRIEDDVVGVREGDRSQVVCRLAQAVLAIGARPPSEDRVIGGDRQRGAVRGRPALVGVSDNLAAEAGADGNETEQDGRERCDTQRAEDAPIRTFPLADDHPRNPDRAQHEQRAQPE